MPTNTNNIKNNKEILKTFAGLAIIAIASGLLASKYIVAQEIITQNNLDIQSLNIKLEQADREKIALQATLDSEKASSRSLEGQIGNLHNDVVTLEKYAKTDKQLLEKYSKIYFLNENYIPESLSNIDSMYLFDKNRSLQFHTKAYSFLQALLGRAKSDGMNLLVASAYRSFNTQSGLKASYKSTFGTTAANKFSADQGYSEHQLGTTVDLTTPTTGGALTGFENTKEYTWLKNNAYIYGFILSYPTTNSYYVFEPWHWRFVGTALASRLHGEGKNFYDLDQRDINDYLIHIFD